jgi:hypothetical protein
MKVYGAINIVFSFKKIMAHKLQSNHVLPTTTLDVGFYMKKTKFLSGLILSSAFIFSQANAAHVPFGITIEFDGGLSASQQNTFIDAENFWETTLTGYAESVNFPPGITISAEGKAMDGVGGVLGSAGPTTAYIYNSNRYTATGAMSFDSADLGNMESNGTLYSVILHEMAHVIGFGTLWQLNGLYDAGSGQYTGAYANEAYRQEFDAAALFVPVELDGGPGTADGHWDETWAGPTSDIMTGYIEGAVTISNTTLAAFRDLGYTTMSVENSSDPAPTNVSVPFIGALSLFGIALFRRRQK